jgi:hypothetical protein
LVGNSSSQNNLSRIRSLGRECGRHALGKKGGRARAELSSKSRRRSNSDNDREIPLK